MRYFFLNFFYLNQNLICPWSIFDKKICSFPSIFARIWMFEHFCSDWAYAEPNFFSEPSKSFFSGKMFLLDGFLDGFSKFRLIIAEICILIWYLWVIFENYSMRMLSIRGNDFIAHWAYEETISSHTESTLNKFFAHAQIAVKFFLQFLHILHVHPNVCWACAETISSHTEHTRKRFYRLLSICGNDFIACWAYAEMI